MSGLYDNFVRWANRGAAERAEAENRQRTIEQQREIAARMDERLAQWQAAARAAQQSGQRVPEMPWDLYTRANQAGMLDLARQANPQALTAQDAMYAETMRQQKMQEEAQRLRNLAEQSRVSSGWSIRRTE